MRILLLAMPDAVNWINNFMKLPNLGITSLAGSLDGHDVKTLDLVVYRPRIRKVLEQTLDGFQPQLVGLSAMSFQFDSLLRIARFIRARNPSIKIAAGGYHITLLGKETAENDDSFPVDFMVRGEGEAAFRELAAELEKRDPDLSSIRQLSYREGGKWRHNPGRPLLDLESLHLPDRRARLARGFSALGLPCDVAETTRGCPNKCKFCSITQMYGPVFRRFPVERVIKDLQAIRAAGTKAVFFADDNIAWDATHFREVCQAITRNGLNDLMYSTQLSALSVAENPEMVDDMQKANFRLAFVGFESMLPEALKAMRKPTNPDINRKAAALLRQHRIGMMAGFIVGFPDDTRDSIKKQFQLVKQLKPDSIYSSIMTPYPKTVLRQEMMDAGLVANVDDYRTYDGFSSNIRTKYLSQKELEQAQKSEAVKFNSSPSFVIHNNILRYSDWRFLLKLAKTVVDAVGDLLLGRRPRQIDL